MSTTKVFPMSFFRKVELMLKKSAGGVVSLPLTTLFDCQANLALLKPHSVNYWKLNMNALWNSSLNTGGVDWVVQDSTGAPFCAGFKVLLSKILTTQI